MIVMLLVFSWKVHIYKDKINKNGDNSNKNLRVEKRSQKDKFKPAVGKAEKWPDILGNFQIKIHEWALSGTTGRFVASINIYKELDLQISSPIPCHRSTMHPSKRLERIISWKRTCRRYNTKNREMEFTYWLLGFPLSLALFWSGKLMNAQAQAHLRTQTHPPRQVIGRLLWGIWPV